jgi:hypothetical protein
LLRRTFGIDVETCPRCGGRMRLLAMVTEPKNVARFLRHLSEPTEPPPRAPARDPPYWQSRLLRRTSRRAVHADGTVRGALNNHKRGPPSLPSTTGSGGRPPPRCPMGSRRPATVVESSSRSTRGLRRRPRKKSWMPSNVLRAVGRRGSGVRDETPRVHCMRSTAVATLTLRATPLPAARSLLLRLRGSQRGHTE